MTVDFTKLNLSLDEVNNQTNKAQNEPCTKLNLTLDKAHFDTIKDNLKDKNEEDNNGFCKISSVGYANSTDFTKPQVGQEGEENQKQMIKVTKSFLEENNIEYELIVGNWGEIKATGARIEVIDN